MSDDFFKVLVIVYPYSYDIFNYSDIIGVSYEENGTNVYTKSTARTVGGAMVGGALMGGAGAVVGGLSGSSTENKEVRNMVIKILLRDKSKTLCTISFMPSGKKLNTKDSIDKKLYEKYLNQATKAKDLLEVIIDDAKQQTAASHVASTQAPRQGIAEELGKLAKLKADGILTEKEFQAQKAKLLS